MSVAEGPGMSTAQRKNPRALLRHFHWHWVKGGASPAIREVLTMLWCDADRNDETTVSLAELAGDLEVSRSTVRTQLRSAERLGLLTTTQRGNSAARRLLLNPVDNCLYCATGPRTTPPKCATKCATETPQVRDPESRTNTGMGLMDVVPSETGEPRAADPRTAEVIAAITTQRVNATKTTIRNPDSYRATVASQVEAELGDKITQLRKQFPRAATNTIVAHIAGEPTHIDLCR